MALPISLNDFKTDQPTVWFLYVSTLVVVEIRFYSCPINSVKMGEKNYQ